MVFNAISLVVMALSYKIRTVFGKRELGTHFQVGAKVRKTIQELGGTMPENLPPAESIKKLEARKRKQPKAMQEPPDESHGESNSDQVGTM